MFDYLKGKVVEAEGNSVLLDVGGFGFRLIAPERDVSSLNEGEEALLYVYLNYRTERFELFGFLREDDRALFDRLLRVANIGSRVSFEILNRLPSERFYEVLEREDVMALSSIPRVGEKRAKRIIFELKGELLKGRGKFADVRSALLNLGYSEKEADLAIAELLKLKLHDESVEELLKKALFFLRGDR